MDIELLLLDAGEVYSSIISSGELVFFSEPISSEIIYAPGVTRGSVSGLLVLPVEQDFLEFFQIYVTPDASEQEVETEFLDDSVVYDVVVSENVVAIDGFIDGLTFFEPTFVVTFSPLLFGGESFYQSVIDSQNEIVLGLIDEAQIFDLELIPGNVDIELDGFIDSMTVFPIGVRGVRVDPLRFKAAESPFGGDISLDYLAPSLNYLPKLPSFNPNNRSDFTYSQVVSLMDRYIPSNEALFSKTFYRAFYIQNDSQFSKRKNIDFWIDGGSTYRLGGDNTIYESEFLVKDEEDRYDVELENRNVYTAGGSSRTSLFGQMNVSYLISPIRTLGRFNADGRGIGIDLRRQVFTPANRKVRLPDLEIGEYIGIYLKIETKFLPDFPIKSDYSFFHLSYTNESNGFRERYPGQVRNSDGDLVSILLPSVFLRVTTDFASLNSYLTEDVRRIYDNYPPYFLSLEDIGEYE